MELILIILLLVNLFYTYYLAQKLKKEEKKHRIIGSFIAGIIKSISDHLSKTDTINTDYLPEKSNKLPISYNNILENIEYEFGKDFWSSSPRGFHPQALTVPYVILSHHTAPIT